VLSLEAIVLAITLLFIEPTDKDHSKVSPQSKMGYNNGTALAAKRAFPHTDFFHPK
jgi:hypothetical protein